MGSKSVVVLGGYGNFGKRIVQNLATIENIQVFVAGRSLEKAREQVNVLSDNSKAVLHAIRLDTNAPEFGEELKALSPFIVIHTGGPFQGQDHRVPLACVDANSHYIDLADDRRFVCDISKLDRLAKQQKVSVVSGASSVPGLSSAVIDHYKSRFSSIDHIDIAIAPGNKAERGEATVRGILSYIGHPYPVFFQGRWSNAYGWMAPRRNYFGKAIGNRWLANADVPDLELFPEHYQVKQSVRFQAGLELAFLHWSMVIMAAVSRIRLIKNWSPVTKLSMKVSSFFRNKGTDRGGMFVHIKGQNQQAENTEVCWSLTALNGVGPYIPTFSTIIVARKLLEGEGVKVGATPCLGLFQLEDFIPYVDELGLTIEEKLVG